MANNRYTVIASVLNVRSGPGTSFSASRTIPSGTIVTVYETVDDWSRIGTNEWVSSQYITLYIPDADSGDNTVKGKVAPSYIPTDKSHDRPIYLLQTDSRWASRPYTACNNSSQTIKSSACGPTSMSMLINEWIDNTYTPIDACKFSLDGGYRTVSDGTSWGFFKAVAVKYGLAYLQAGTGDEVMSFLEKYKDCKTGVICSMAPGVWTSGGHFILMYYCDGNNVYVNDPGSTAEQKQKNLFTTLKNQCRQYFCFAKTDSASDKTTWEPKDETITYTTPVKFIVSASVLNVRKQPTTSNGDNILGTVTEGMILTATKKCGDWYCIETTNAKKKMIGWCAANYLEHANIKASNADIASNCIRYISLLYRVGIITQSYRTYLLANAYRIDHFATLIIELGRAIEENNSEYNGKRKFINVISAINFLATKKLITNATYWKANYRKITNLNKLFCNIAEWVS